jgi:hypothetical protein
MGARPHRPDADGRYPLARVVAMIGHPVEENPLDLLVDIVVVDIETFGVDVTRHEVAACAWGLIGPARSRTRRPAEPTGIDDLGVRAADSPE